jgi:hypothetical protein
LHLLPEEAQENSSHAACYQAYFGAAAALSTSGSGIELAAAPLMQSFPPSVLERNYGDIGRDAVRKRVIIDALLEMERMLIR